MRWLATYSTASAGDGAGDYKPDPDSAGVDRSQLEHISPIEWENLLLYGQYLIDRSLIRTA